MNCYDIFMKPIEKRFLYDIRRNIIPLAYGNVLEVGIGTGVNIPLYDFGAVKSLTGLDVKLSKEIVQKADYRIALIESGAEQMPFTDNSFDTVVTTLVLCSVDNPSKSISEIKRVLKKDGQYLFIEHILPSDKKLANIFQSCNGLWSKITHGCNLNRKSDCFISNSFDVKSIAKEVGTVLCYGMAKNVK